MRECHGSPPTVTLTLTTYEEIIKPTNTPDIYHYDRVLARMQAQTMPQVVEIPELQLITGLIIVTPGRGGPYRLGVQKLWWMTAFDSRILFLTG